jgi:putative FmdB family regulatory protein
LRWPSLWEGVGGCSDVEPARPAGLESVQSLPGTWSHPMPHYEFFCHNCKKLFSKILSLVDYEEGEVLCPHCGSKEVEQRWSAFSILTTKKSA